MLRELGQAARFTLVTMVLLGGGYPLLLWGVARLTFPTQADGSLIRRSDGTLIGSRLIAQRFTRPEYFHSRPSGVDYNAASAGGTNYGLSNADHLLAVEERLATVIAREHVTADRVPSEMITASGAGLDPHLPPAAAELQAARIAGSRGVDVARVRALVAAHTEQPALGFLGRTRVNLLELNIALDEAFDAPNRSSNH